jgi:plasmid stabilization system protein ParE
MPRMTYDERADLFDADLSAAATAHDSDHALGALLSRPRLDGRERVLIIAALGESGTGPDGSAAVRAQFSHAMSELATASKYTRAGWRDEACAAVIALAQRDGPAATDVYLEAIASTNPIVHDYGLDALASEGDDRGRDSMVAFISEILSRTTISATRWRDLIKAVEYLARNADLGSARAEQLITLLRAHWARLASPPQIKEKRGHPTYTHTRPATPLEALWPGIQPDGPPADAIDLPRLHTSTAWWLPRNQPPPSPTGSRHAQPRSPGQ